MTGKEGLTVCPLKGGYRIGCRLMLPVGGVPGGIIKTEG